MKSIVITISLTDESLFCSNMNFFFSTFLLFLLIELNSGYTKLNGELNRAKNELTCDTDDECQNLLLESKCIRKLCQCPTDKLLSSDGSKCLTKAKQYGSPCEDNIQCSNLLSTGGICDNKICVCKSGYHYLKGSCWRSAGLHEKCSRDEQCFATYEYIGLTCREKECVCRTNYRERLKSGCRRERRTGESCNLNDDCIDGSTCKRICTRSDTVNSTLNISSFVTIGGEKRQEENLNCPKGKFELNNECVPELGMECTSDSECSEIKNALCLDNLVCACKPVEYVAGENNRECLRVARGMVDDIRQSSCKKDRECGVFGENSICENKRCACKNGTYFEKENKFCWKIKSLGESCSDSKDCHTSETHAECVETKSGKLCRCKEGYHAKDLDCVPDALEVGDPCEVDEECLFPNSFCNSSKTCACRKHYYHKNGKCEPGVGKLCTTDADCAQLNNTECKVQDLPVKQCLCLVNQTNSDDYKYCLPIVNFGNECLESFQCKFRLGELGECKQNRCECLEGTHYCNGKCYKSKFLGESCLKLQDCYPGNDTNSVICLKGYCSCNYDYRELAETGVCVKTNSAASTKFHSMSLATLVLFVALRRRK